MAFKRDQEKFSAWIKAHQQALYRHAYWMTGDAEIAADLVQETFFQAWRDRRRLREEAKILPWLLTILRRSTYRELDYRRGAPQGMDSVTLAEIGPAAEEDLSLLLDLHQLLARLSPSHREVLLLYALHGFSYEEIGAHLDIPIGTVMSRVARARSALKTQASHAELADTSDKVIPFSPNTLSRGQHHE